ncbi:hypothetical protein D3C75_525850 [compost metagenome]
MRRFDQAHRIHDHHGGERGVGHQANERCQQQASAQRQCGGDQCGQLRTGAGQAVHCRLGGPATGDHGPEKRATDVGNACGQQFPIRLWRGLVTAGESAPRRDGFGETHQRDTHRRGPQGFDHRPNRQGRCGQPDRHHADGGHTKALQAKQAHADDAKRHRNQRCGQPGRKTLHAHQQQDHEHTDRHGRQRGMADALDRGHQIVQEAAFVDVRAQQLGQLVEHDDHADAGLETHQYRLGNEIGDETQAQQPRDNQDRTHHQGQRGGTGEQGRRIAIGADLAQRGAGKNGQGGRGADAKRARRAEHGIDHHRHQHRVQPDLHRQAGNGGVRQRLGNDHGRCRQPGDHIAAQPVWPVAAEPLRDQQAAQGSPLWSAWNPLLRMAALLIHRSLQWQIFHADDEWARQTAQSFNCTRNHCKPSKASKRVCRRAISSG